ncbi:MAG: hypothetical protein IJL87_01720 [Clostridia bacterium]|nr:hypothetical protein [Clostridia bacterium]
MFSDSTDNDYSDIIDLPHPTSASHPRMSRRSRAAQFSPFAALTGYDDAIDETARYTDSKGFLNEDSKAILDFKLSQIADRIQGAPQITVEYFKPDEKKSGGAYVRHTGCIKKIDSIGRLLVFKDGTEIPLDDIFDMEIN